MGENIPRLIVRDCLRVREGEMVHISSWPYAMDLASQIAIECFESLAVPLITLTTEELLEWALTEAPVEALRIVPEHEVAIAKAVGAYVHISGPADPSIMARASSDRFRAFSEAGAKASEALRQGGSGRRTFTSARSRGRGRRGTNWSTRLGEGPWRTPWQSTMRR